MFLAVVPGIGPARVFATAVWRVFRASLRWVFSDWRHLALTGLLLLILRDHALQIPDLKRQLRSEMTGRKACEGTVSNLQEAARKAASTQQANLARVASERAENDQKVLHDYQDRLAALRTRYERLQPQAAAADPGLSGAIDMPTGMEGSGRIAEASDDTGLPTTRTCAPMSLYERLVASEQAEQLNSLIDAVEMQAAIRTSP